MSEKEDRRAAREVIAAYHEAQLSGLLMHVVEAVDGFRRGDLDAFAVDDVIFQYSRAAKKLWVFCGESNVASLARIIDESPALDWWERGSFRRRG